MKKDKPLTWNDLPLDERERLMPIMLEAQIRQITIDKQKAITAHRNYINSLNRHIKNIQDEYNSLYLAK